MRWTILPLFLLGMVRSVAQVDSANVPFSENGWYLSPHGTIRVLVIFAEIEYDKNPQDDPQPGGSGHWPKGQMPLWKDQLFDAHALTVPQGEVTRYYHDISLGRYVVLGDHLDELVTIKESEASSLKSSVSISTNAVVAANKRDEFRTAHRLGIADFDHWKDGGKPGLPKAPGADDPHSFDHVMTIVRNSPVLTHGQGSTDGGSSGKLFGYESDTQSRFGAMSGMPFAILKHEFNHLLLGGNNFHSGGGNAPTFQSFFINVQGGWSMMGAAGSSLLTTSAWDRDRLGWHAEDAPFRVNAHDAQGRVVNGDIDPLQGDTGIYVLHDMIPSGDALRIRMPHLAEGEYRQWLWIENHQTRAKNGSPTDRFHFEIELSCVRAAVPGLYAVLQVDRDTKRGKDIYQGHADYLRPLPATGSFDRRVDQSKTRYECLWGGEARPLLTEDRWANPFSGTHELELPSFDMDQNGVILRTKEHVPPQLQIFNGQLLDDGRFHGHPDQVFTPAGRNKLGMATNPALVNTYTLVNTPGKDSYQGRGPNVRTVHLAGFSLTLLEQRADGAIVVRVRNDDTRVDRDVRWCGDSIVLHAPAVPDTRALVLEARRTILLDRSLTPTRIDRPETVDGRTYFSACTRFVLAPGASMLLGPKAKLDLRHGSELHVLPGATLELPTGSKLQVDQRSIVVLHDGGRLLAPDKVLRKARKKGRIITRPGPTAAQ